MFCGQRTRRYFSVYLLLGLLLQVFAAAASGASMTQALEASRSPAMLDLCRSPAMAQGDTGFPASIQASGHCLLCAVTTPPPEPVASLFFLFKQHEPRAFAPAAESPPALPSGYPGDEQPPRAPPIL
ncbi:hypothetical protein OPU71_04220 [Niveibacterium sp. 24ML]|uniref:DUF2946 family protein n=1 Tax=Niveibacterium sp. 24ML TaxID=2985512 RepID=UPI00226F853D|nr:DUF2946 family protein [Niveibacterium sp. 24ML]MCX9155323.1 hypothetical protein [Niveibacterium sp. 24ML]